MNDNELTQYADEIYRIFALKENENLSEHELIDIVKSKLIIFGTEHRKIGRNQIINHFKVEVSNLESKENLN